MALDEALQLAQDNLRLLDTFVKEEEKLINQQISAKAIQNATKLGIQFATSSKHRKHEFTLPPSKCTARLGEHSVSLNLIRLRLKNGGLQDVFSDHSYRELCTFMAQARHRAHLAAPHHQGQLNPLAKIIKSGLS